MHLNLSTLIAEKLGEIILVKTRKNTKSVTKNNIAVIHKKIWPEYFNAIVSGEKKLELRLNDFKIIEGDALILEERNPKTKEYTGRNVKKKVSYVKKFRIDKLFWLEEQIKEKGIQIISLK